jgi:hypothetical protein
MRGQHQRTTVLRRAVFAFLVFEVSGRAFGAALESYISIGFGWGGS